MPTACEAAVFSTESQGEAFVTGLLRTCRTHVGRRAPCRVCRSQQTVSPRTAEPFAFSRMTGLTVRHPQWTVNGDRNVARASSAAPPAKNFGPWWVIDRRYSGAYKQQRVRRSRFPCVNGAEGRPNHGFSASWVFGRAVRRDLRLMSFRRRAASLLRTFPCGFGCCATQTAWIQSLRPDGSRGHGRRSE